MKPTYIVSGVPRSGTSMLMQCCIAGGMGALAAWEDKANVRLSKLHENSPEKYHPNPNGYFELCREKTRLENFPPDALAGKLFKFLLGGLVQLRPLPGGYRIAFMTRDPNEISASHRRTYNMPTGTEHICALEYFGILRQQLSTLNRERADFEITILKFKNIMEDAPGELGKLAKAGWPLDPEKAARAVNRKLWRNRAA